MLRLGTREVCGFLDKTKKNEKDEKVNQSSKILNTDLELTHYHVPWLENKNGENKNGENFLGIGPSPKNGGIFLK